MASYATKQALAAALHELLQTHTLDEITVTQIVDTCGINRQTFYYHFQNIYALAEWTFQQDLQHLTHGHIQLENWQEGLQQIYAYMYQNRMFVLNLYHSVSHKPISVHLKEWLHPFLASTIRSHAVGMHIAEEDLRFIVDIYIFMFMGITLDWVHAYMPTPYPSTLHQFYRLLEGTLDTTLEKFSL